MLFKAISGGSACLTAGRTVRAACRFRILRYESGGKQKTKGKSVFRLVGKTAGIGFANMGSNPIAQSRWKVFSSLGRASELGSDGSGFDSRNTSI